MNLQELEIQELKSKKKSAEIFYEYQKYLVEIGETDRYMLAFAMERLNAIDYTCCLKGYYFLLDGNISAC